MKRIMDFAMKLVFMVASDLYRGLVGIKKLIEGDFSLDIAYITNFQNDVERGFLGITSLFWRKPFAYALRLHLDGFKGRFVGINAISKELMSPKNRDDVTAMRAYEEKKTRIKGYILLAIKDVIRRGAKVVLFGASTKRLFSEEEIVSLKKHYPQVIFTIGDNGTAIELWRDVAEVIKRKGISPTNRVMIIGPNGFLGSVVRCALKKAGFDNLIFVSQKEEKPFDGINDVKLVVACNHHESVRLTAGILKDITHPDGICVVDVCRPSNFSRREYRTAVKMGLVVERQDAGNTFNTNLKYDVASISNIALNQLTLSPQRLFGCFSEATAIAAVFRDNPEILRSRNFMSVNTEAIRLVEQAFREMGFHPSPEVNFGKVMKEGERKVKTEWSGGSSLNSDLSAYEFEGA
ncbi:MAG: hypothetical protein OEV93_00870 [Candidatus Moranbacteria bacterium]|nr:hypothetical protein [Candidatus Moranbacteria bacterium]